MDEHPQQYTAQQAAMPMGLPGAMPMGQLVHMGLPRPTAMGLPGSLGGRGPLAMHRRGPEPTDPKNLLLASHLNDALSEKDAANSSLLISLSKRHAQIIKSLSNNQDTQVEATQDLKNHLASLISESKFEEAFSCVLLSHDNSTLYWLCSQVDLVGILSLFPLPLSQIVVLTILHKLSLELHTKTRVTPEKLNWITHLAAAIDPMDPMIAMHVKPVFKQLYGQCCYSTMEGIAGRQFPSICNRVLLHVLKSVLMMCK